MADNSTRGHPWACGCSVASYLPAQSPVSSSTHYMTSASDISMLKKEQLYRKQKQGPRKRISGCGGLVLQAGVHSFNPAPKKNPVISVLEEGQRQGLRSLRLCQSGQNANFRFSKGQRKQCKKHTQTNKRKAHCTPGTPQGQFCQLCHTEKGQLPLPFRPSTWCPGQKEARKMTLEANQLPRPNHSQDPVLWGFSQQLLGHPASGCGLRCSVCTGECREEHARSLGR